MNSERLENNAVLLSDVIVSVGEYFSTCALGTTRGLKDFREWFVRSL